MKTIPLRYLAELNPAVPEFDALPSDAEVGFLALESVWADDRADHGRLANKTAVASGYVRFASGDIVVPKVTPTFQAARSMITATVGAGSTELHVLRARPGVDPRWVCYATRNAHFLREGVAAFQGVAGLQRVPAGFVEAFRIADVSPDSQRRIADFLDDRVTRIDRIIAARREQVIGLRRVRQAGLQQLQNELVDHYGACRLSYLLRGLEQGWSPQADSVPAGAHEWGVMRSGCVNGGRFRGEDNKRLPDDLVPRVEYEIRAGDLLMSRASGSLDLIGSVAVVPLSVRSRLLLCDKIYRLSPSSDWSARYLAHSLSSPESRQQIQLGVSGAEGMANNLPSGVVKDLRVPRAPRHVQDEAVARTDELYSAESSAVDAISRSVALLTEYKSSLITAAVTGELDVTTAGSGIPG